ncbi:hypothetical protein [Methanococcoides alaskense]|uniref:CRISP-associated protein Cas1 n=1 Tax=Methanococcoides alaskense TaxID=325778 RepID=A0AA90Z6C4_9EURY|nr:hypothetical protein [Methanococcoides alaskense]MDA0525464.1 hypothetical protein [Methanococcoides alaskense]MDR6221601.1 hypothetical protein [Methanococcoides alaskense]
MSYTVKTIEFNKPVYVGKRDDSDFLRKRIIDMPYAEWKKMGFSKGTLHYMKQNAKSDKLFTLNAHMRESGNREFPVKDKVQWWGLLLVY